MTDTTTLPHWEVIFDKAGDTDQTARAALIDALATSGLTDVVFFSHGWNNSPDHARALYHQWFAMLPPLLPASSDKHIGTVGIIWPSMLWPDDAIPNFDAASGGAASLADGDPLAAIVDAQYEAGQSIFDDEQRKILGELVALLDSPPTSDQAIDTGLASIQQLMKALVASEGTASVPEDDGATAMLTANARDMAQRFADAQGTGVTRPAPVDEGGVDSLGFSDASASVDGDGGIAGLGDIAKTLWNGAKEAVRQLTYWQMKRRAGIVGQNGLGPLLQDLSTASSSLRIHLLGHSFGARLVSFSLKGVATPGAANIKSLMMLQGAYSHNAFGTNLEWGTPNGALNGQEAKVSGPIVACFSEFDTAVGDMYVLASMAAQENAAAVAASLQPEWGGMGHDGVQGGVTVSALSIVSGTTTYPVAQQGFVNVDAKAVVCTGHFPSGAHSDIFHPELAGVLVAAAQLG